MTEDITRKRALKPVVANISNRHVHLSPEILEKLFGQGYVLTKIKDLVQPGEHACKETVKIVGKKGVIEKVRVLGPLRKYTQVEVSRTDCYVLGTDAPVRSSGDIAGSSPVTIIGQKGSVELAEGLIIAQRHVHMAPIDAGYYGVHDKELVSIHCGAERGIVFEKVIVRVSERMALECHLDTDEANAAGIKNGELITIC